MASFLIGIALSIVEFPDFLGDCIGPWT